MKKTLALGEFKKKKNQPIAERNVTNKNDCVRKKGWNLKLKFWLKKKKCYFNGYFKLMKTAWNLHFHAFDAIFLDAGKMRAPECFGKRIIFGNSEIFLLALL